MGQQDNQHQKGEQGGGKSPRKQPQSPKSSKQIKRPQTPQKSKQPATIQQQGMFSDSTDDDDEQFISFTIKSHHPNHPADGSNLSLAEQSNSKQREGTTTSITDKSHHSFQDNVYMISQPSQYEVHTPSASPSLTPSASPSITPASTPSKRRTSVMNLPRTYIGVILPSMTLSSSSSSSATPSSNQPPSYLTVNYRLSKKPVWVEASFHFRLRSMFSRYDLRSTGRIPVFTFLENMSSYFQSHLHIGTLLLIERVIQAEVATALQGDPRISRVGTPYISLPGFYAVLQAVFGALHSKFMNIQAGTSFQHAGQLGRQQGNQYNQPTNMQTQDQDQPIMGQRQRRGSFDNNTPKTQSGAIIRDYRAVDEYNLMQQQNQSGTQQQEITDSVLENIDISEFLDVDIALATNLQYMQIPKATSTATNALGSGNSVASTTFPDSSLRGGLSVNSNQHQVSGNNSKNQSNSSNPTPTIPTAYNWKNFIEDGAHYVSPGIQRHLRVVATAEYMKLRQDPTNTLRELQHRAKSQQMRRRSIAGIAGAFNAPGVSAVSKYDQATTGTAGGMTGGMSTGMTTQATATKLTGTEENISISDSKIGVIEHVGTGLGSNNGLIDNSNNNSNFVNGFNSNEAYFSDHNLLDNAFTYGFVENSDVISQQIRYATDMMVQKEDMIEDRAYEEHLNECQRLFLCCRSRKYHDNYQYAAGGNGSNNMPDNNNNRHPNAPSYQTPLPAYLQTKSRSKLRATPYIPPVSERNSCGCYRSLSSISSSQRRRSCCSCTNWFRRKIAYIEAMFGSSTASYFYLAKNILLLNFILSIIVLIGMFPSLYYFDWSLPVIYEQVILDPTSSNPTVVDVPLEQSYSGFLFGTGMERSFLFYGNGYERDYPDFLLGFRMELSYLLTIGSALLMSLLLLIICLSPMSTRKIAMAANGSDSLSALKASSTYSIGQGAAPSYALELLQDVRSQNLGTLIFTSLDFSTTDVDAMELRRMHLVSLLHARIQAEEEITAHAKRKAQKVHLKYHTSNLFLRRLFGIFLSICIFGIVYAGLILLITYRHDIIISATPHFHSFAEWTVSVPISFLRIFGAKMIEMIVFQFEKRSTVSSYRHVLFRNFLLKMTFIMILLFQTLTQKISDAENISIDTLIPPSQSCPQTAVGIHYYQQIFSDLLVEIFFALILPPLMMGSKFLCRPCNPLTVPELPNNPTQSERSYFNYLSLVYNRSKYDLLKGEFTLHDNLLDLVSEQALIWAALPYAPMIPFIALFFYSILIIVKYIQLRYFRRISFRPLSLSGQISSAKLYLLATLALMTVSFTYWLRFAVQCGPYVSNCTPEQKEAEDTSSSSTDTPGGFDWAFGLCTGTPISLLVREIKQLPAPTNAILNLLQNPLLLWGCILIAIVYGLYTHNKLRSLREDTSELQDWMWTEKKELLALKRARNIRITMTEETGKSVFDAFIRELPLILRESFRIAMQECYFNDMFHLLRLDDVELLQLLDEWAKMDDVAPEYKFFIYDKLKEQRAKIIR